MSGEISLTQKGKGVDSEIRVDNGMVYHSFIDEKGFKVSSEFELTELGFLENRFTVKNEKKVAIYKLLIISAGCVLMVFISLVLRHFNFPLNKESGIVYYFFGYWAVFLGLSFTIGKYVPGHKVVSLAGGGRFITQRTDLPSPEEVDTFIKYLKSSFYQIVMEEHLNGSDLHENTIKRKLEFLISRKVILRSERDNLLEQLVRTNEKKIGF